jgi:hypothetical protein
MQQLFYMEAGKILGRFGRFGSFQTADVNAPSGRFIRSETDRPFGGFGQDSLGSRVDGKDEKKLKIGQKSVHFRQKSVHFGSKNGVLSRKKEVLKAKFVL